MPSRANLSHSPINRVTSRQSRSRPATPMASCMKRRKHPWNCAGSSSRNTRLNVSWLGTPWRSRRSCRRNAALARPNTAMSEQSSPPHNMVQKPITGISCRSCGVLTSRGTLQRGKAGRKPLHGTPTQQNSMVRTRHHAAPQPSVPRQMSNAIPLPSTHGAEANDRVEPGGDGLHGKWRSGRVGRRSQTADRPSATSASAPSPSAGSPSAASAPPWTSGPSRS